MELVNTEYRDGEPQQPRLRWLYPETYKDIIVSGFFFATNFTRLCTKDEDQFSVTLERLQFKVNIKIIVLFFSIK